MSWDYADLSHMAKEAGGPDLLLNTLESAARGQGRIEGAGVGALAAGAVISGVVLIYNQYKKRKRLAADTKAALKIEINEPSASDVTAMTASTEVPAARGFTELEPDANNTEETIWED